MFMIMKNNVVKLLCVLMMLGMFGGCSSTPGNTQPTAGPEEITGSETEEEKAPAEDRTGDDAGDADDTDDVEQASEDEDDYWKGPDENKWDGGPDFTSIATQFSGIFRNLTIEDAAEKYAITLGDGGKYAGYEGDIGEIIPEYKDVDLDGDRKSDVIRREGSHYVIECSSAGTFSTNDFSTSPNEGEIIEFEDMACRNIDEIMVAHYTFGTGGPVVWDTAVYSYQKGKWEKYPLVDEGGNINSQELRDYINKKTGREYEPHLAEVRSADMTTLLLDFGHKDGPVQINDYEAQYLHRNFDPEYADNSDDYSCYASYDFMQLLNHWPLDIPGEAAELTGELQNKLNVYLSNFSEQDYGKDGKSEDRLAHFALQWQRINKGLKPVTKDGRTYYRLSHSDINRILIRFFGGGLEEGEFYLCGEDNDFGGCIVYEDDDNYYCEPAADGEMYANNAFSVATAVENLGGYKQPDEYLRISFKVYRLDTDEYDEHGIGSKQDRLSAAEAAKLADNGGLYEAYEGTAIVAPVDGEYWLLDYRISGE